MTKELTNNYYIIYTIIIKSDDNVLNNSAFFEYLDGKIIA